MFSKINLDLFKELYELPVTVEEKVAKTLVTYIAIKNPRYKVQRDIEIEKKDKSLTNEFNTYGLKSFTNVLGLYVFLGEKSIQLKYCNLQTYKNCNKPGKKYKKNMINIIRKKATQKCRNKIIFSSILTIRNSYNR